MKFLNLAIVLIVNFFLFACSPPNSGFKDNQGKVVTLDNIKGKWLIVNYWADWCEGCVAELPQLNAFYQQNKNENILLLSVNYDHLTVERLNEVIKKRNIAYPVLVDDPRTVLNLTAVDVIPVTYILNPDKKVVKVFEGPTTEKDLKSTLQQLMR